MERESQILICDTVTYIQI